MKKGVTVVVVVLGVAFGGMFALWMFSGMLWGVWGMWSLWPHRDPAALVKSCGGFEGGELAARWSDCGSRPVPSIVCEGLPRQATCHCSRDGGNRGLFFASYPSLQDRESAERLWRDQCAQWDR